MRNILWIGLGAIILASVALPSMTEGYFKPYPYIDTSFSKDFSWTGWDAVQPGMTSLQLEQLLGRPLSGYDGIGGSFRQKSGQPMGGPCVTYSQNGGGYAFWDFAWIAVNVCFGEHGEVAGKNELIMYQ